LGEVESLVGDCRPPPPGNPASPPLIGRESKDWWAEGEPA
jgi:hypothetical protein